MIRGRRQGRARELIAANQRMSQRLEEDERRTRDDLKRVQTLMREPLHSIDWQWYFFKVYQSIPHGAFPPMPDNIERLNTLFSNETFISWFYMESNIIDVRITAIQDAAPNAPFQRLFTGTQMLDAELVPINRATKHPLSSPPEVYLALPYMHPDKRTAAKEAIKTGYTILQEGGTIVVTSGEFKGELMTQWSALEGTRVQEILTFYEPQNVERGAEILFTLSTLKARSNQMIGTRVTRPIVY